MERRLLWDGTVGVSDWGSGDLDGGSWGILMVGGLLVSQEVSINAVY